MASHARRFPENIDSVTLLRGVALTRPNGNGPPPNWFSTSGKWEAVRAMCSAYRFWDAKAPPPIQRFGQLVTELPQTSDFRQNGLVGGVGGGGCLGVRNSAPPLSIGRIIYPVGHIDSIPPPHTALPSPHRTFRVEKGKQKRQRFQRLTISHSPMADRFLNARWGRWEAEVS